MGFWDRIKQSKHQSKIPPCETCLSPSQKQSQSGTLQETRQLTQSPPAPKTPSSTPIQHSNSPPVCSPNEPAIQSRSSPSLTQCSPVSMPSTLDFSTHRSDSNSTSVQDSKSLPGQPLLPIPSNFYDETESSSLADIPGGPPLKQAVLIRRKLQPLRALYSKKKRAIQEEVQRLLKEWEKLLADKNSASPETLQKHKELGCVTEKLIKGRCQDLNLLWKSIQPLEHELDAAENRLLESEEQESHSEPPRIMIPSEPLPTPNVHEKTEATPLTSAVSKDSDKERVEDVEAWSDENDAEEDRDWDPSRYHPKYVELQDQIANVKLAEERVNYFIRRMAKLQEQKKKRDKVKLRLLPIDEQEMERLPNKILSLQLELDAEREKAESLRDECLFLGIANEDESPVEVISVTEEESENLETTAGNDRENEDAQPQYEVWVIKTPGGKKSRTLSNEAAWAAASVTRDLHHSEESIYKSIQRLERKKKAVDNYKHLTAAQKQCVDALRDRRNSEKPNSKIRWFPAQIELKYRNTYRNVSSRSSKGGRRRLVVAITVYFKSEHKPAATDHKIEEFGLATPQQNGTPHKPSTGSSPPPSQQHLKPTPPQIRALRSHTTPATTSGSSGLTNLALTINHHGHPSGAATAHSEPKSADEEQPNSNWVNELTYVEWWIFQQLEISCLEVRLLATILQAAGVPWSEKTAQLVMKHWNHRDGPDEERRYWAAQSSRPNWKAAAKQIREEGYDKMLLPQVLGYALRIGSLKDEIEDESEQDDESLRGSELDNAELGLV